MTVDASSLMSLAQERKPLRAFVIVLANWAIIVLAWMLAARAPNAFVFVVVFLMIGIQQHALGLWMHESAHWLLTRSKRMNDFCSTLFLSGPLLVPLRAYRARHFAHHGFLGTPQDTKQVIFTRIDGSQFWRFIFLTCTGLQLFSIAKGYTSSTDPMNRRIAWTTWIGDALAILCVQAVIILLISTFAPWTFYFWFWLLPWFTVNRVLAGLRAIIEHQPLGDERHPFVRTLRPNLVERIVFCRAGFDSHWTHHRYPTVPCFNLKRINIATEQPLEKQKGYFATLRALIRRTSAPLT